MRFYGNSQPVDSTPLSGFEAFKKLLDERHEAAHTDPSSIEETITRAVNNRVAKTVKRNTNDITTTVEVKTKHLELEAS